VKRALIIRLSSMGDVVLAASCIDYLKKRHPSCEIHFLTNERYTGLYADDPRLCSVCGVDTNGWSTLLPALAALDWDIIIDLQNNRKSCRMRRRFFPHVPVRKFDKLHLNRYLLLFLRLNRYAPADHVAARYVAAAAAHPVAAGDIVPPRLFFNGDGARLRRDIFGAGAAAQPLLALFPFSAWKNKQWPLSSYAAVARHFMGKGWSVVILGSTDDRAAAMKLSEEAGDGCAACAGELTLHEIGCLLSSCDLALGNDTGLSHLARACGVKTGVIYGSTTRHFGFFPFGEPAFMVFESRRLCRPCHPHGGNLCWRLSRLCLASVRASEVMRGLELLHGGQTPAADGRRMMLL